MALPQLIAEDVRELDRLLGDLVTRSEATAALIIDKAGFLISHSGDTSKFDSTTLAALAAGCFAATQGMASVVNEPNFNSVYQQGELYSLLVDSVGEVLSLESRDYQRNPPTLNPRLREFSDGIYRLNDSLLVVLSVSSLLNFGNRADAA